MANSIRLTVLTGPHKGNSFCFREPSGTSTIGRSSDCDVCLRGDARDQCISRHHCQLTFDLPNVQVLDLGSVNGTFVNGQPCAAPAGNPTWRVGLVPVTATDGDILTVGGTSLQINIMDCTHRDDQDKIIKNCSIEC